MGHTGKGIDFRLKRLDFISSIKYINSVTFSKRIDLFDYQYGPMQNRIIVSHWKNNIRQKQHIWCRVNSQCMAAAILLSLLLLLLLFKPPCRNPPKNLAFRLLALHNSTLDILPIRLYPEFYNCSILEKLNFNIPLW